LETLQSFLHRLLERHWSLSSTTCRTYPLTLTLPMLWPGEGFEMQPGGTFRAVLRVRVCIFGVAAPAGQTAEVHVLEADRLDRVGRCGLTDDFPRRAGLYAEMPTHGRLTSCGN
jgi:hypothetical protein